MSQVLLGKVLLRNVIWHTEAHNQIQEESDIWKVREIEKQMEDTYQKTKRKMFPGSSSQVWSDRFDEERQREYWRPKTEISGTLEDGFLKSKSWNKKLYDYKASMPDRCDHSGYKELYPEEFETDSDQQDITKGKKTPQIKSSTHEFHKYKKSKKSHKKKQKRRSDKKQKESKKEATDVTAHSSSESSEEIGASSTTS